MTGSRGNQIVTVLAAVMAVMAVGSSRAMQELGEDEMSGISGAGIALGFEDLRVRAGATTYLEYSGTTASGTFQSANARYYGMSLSGETPVTSWGGICGAGIAGMGCPIGDQIPFFAAFDNPYILRAFDYNGIKYNGVSEDRTVLELLGPSQQSPWRLASWAELDVGNGNALHQGQMMVTNTTLTSEDGSPGLDNNAKIRILQNSDPLDQTLGFIWENHYSGNFRYSVAQTFLSPDTQGVIPFFQDEEGFYALNIQTFVPLGQMFYQSLIFDDAKDSFGNETGNLVIELTRIPNNSNVYLDFYSFAGAESTDAGYVRTGRPDRYFETHGFFKVGTPGTLNDSGTQAQKNTDTNDGLFFVKSTDSAPFTARARRPDINFSCSTGDTGGGCLPGADQINAVPNLTAVNIGDINIEGLMIQHLKLTTCSAGSGTVC